MPRSFTKEVKREALARSGKRCEATGGLYGLPEGVRCEADLSYGVQFDHYILWANSRDSSLDNCLAVCPKCHRFKTDNYDTPKAAKTLRQQEKNDGIRHTRNPLPGGRHSPLKKKLNGEVVER